jgi:hypothetical protein
MLSISLLHVFTKYTIQQHIFKWDLTTLSMDVGEVNTMPYEWKRGRDNRSFSGRWCSFGSGAMRPAWRFLRQMTEGGAVRYQVVTDCTYVGVSHPAINYFNYRYVHKCR